MRWPRRIASFSSQPPLGSSVTRASGEALVQRDHRVHFFVAAQHAALELEIVEAVALARGLGQAHHGLGRHRLFVPQAAPGVVGARFARIGQARLLLVADEEQVAQHLHRIALLAFAQQRGHRHFQVLAQQVQQRRLHRRHGVNGGAQVEGLQPAPAGVAVGEAGLQLLQHLLVRPDRLAHHQGARVLQRLADLLAPRHLAHTGAPGAVGEDEQVAREERRVRAAQVEQHAVAARDGDDAQFGDAGGGRHEEEARKKIQRNCRSGAKGPIQGCRGSGFAGPRHRPPGRGLRAARRG